MHPKNCLEGQRQNFRACFTAKVLGVSTFLRLMITLGEEGGTFDAQLFAALLNF